MPTTISCPHCSARLKLPDSAAGKTVKCPKCNERFQTPAAAAVSASSPQPPKPQAAQPVTQPQTPAPKGNGLKGLVGKSQERVSSAAQGIGQKSSSADQGPPPPAPAAAPSSSVPQSANDGQLRCPKCGSTQVSADKKGFGGGKGCCGWLFFGPLGILCGFCGSKKVLITCLACGKQWLAGKA